MGAVGVAGHAAFEVWAVGEEHGLDAEILDGFEGRADGCGSELGLGSGAGVEEEMGV